MKDNRKPRQDRNHISLELGFWDQGPCLELERILQDDRAGMYIAKLRQHVYLAGDLRGIFTASETVLAHACRYKGPPGDLAIALQEAGVLKAGKKAKSWRYIDWLKIPTGQYLLSKAIDAARQRERRQTKYFQTDATEVQENAENGRETPENEKSYKGGHVRGRPGDVGGKKERKKDNSHSPPTPSTGAGAAGAAEAESASAALWAWFWEHYPKPMAPVKCRALFDALTPESRALIRPHVERVIMRAKEPRFVPEMLNYLAKEPWWAMRAKKPAQQSPATAEKPKAAVAKQPTVHEDQASTEAVKAAAEQAMFKLRQQGKNEGLRGAALDEWVNERIATHSRN